MSLFPANNIPGVQPKVSAEMISFPLSQKGKHQSYFLKLESPEFPRLIHNEQFFMTAARELDIEVAETKIIYDKNKNPGLLVKRFDRQYDSKTKSVELIHQEDACQFLDRYPADKYRLKTRVIAESINELCSAPIIEISKLIRIVAYSYLIVNGDLHAKNISIRTNKESGCIGLTPFYDLLTTLPYKDDTLALEFQAKKSNLKRQNFIEFGKLFGVREKSVNSILDLLCDGIVSVIDRVPEIGLTPKQTNHLQKEMKQRRELLGHIE